MTMALAILLSAVPTLCNVTFYMKKIKYILFLILTLSFSMAFASHWVKGYTRSNGTYVAGHMSDDPGERRMLKNNPSTDTNASNVSSSDSIIILNVLISTPT